MSRTIIYIVILTISLIYVVNGHGGMQEPPMRSLAWKYGFDAPVNYDWMSLYCGGLGVFQQNNGKCGLCGDPANGPFENDKGGVYDTGVIVRHYPIGLREIEVKIELTAHHKGYFSFKLCPNNEQELTQHCLDRYPLLIREGRQQGDPTRFYPPKDPKLNELHVLLPEGITCDRCVLQWTYTAGNSVGQSPSGEMCMGCGLQETFVNCADISIGGSLDSILVQKSRTPEQDGEVVVLNGRSDLEKIINDATPEIVNDIFNDLPNNPRGNGDGLPTNIDPRQRDPSAPDSGPQRDFNWQPETSFPERERFRDPRMFIPLPSQVNHIPFDQHRQRPMVNTDIGGFNQPGSVPSVIVHGSIWGPATLDIPPPSQIAFPSRQNMFPSRGNTAPNKGLEVPTRENNLPIRGADTSLRQKNGHHVTNNANVIDSTGTHNSLIGSVGSIVEKINPNMNKLNHQPEADQQSTPSRQFVHQMNKLRQQFPSSVEWRRGDGMHSHREAVRHAPHIDTQDFTTQEIHNQVPSLPNDIGPRQDISPFMDPRIQQPEISQLRQNWFPGSQIMRHHMRMNSPKPRRFRLPRRIIVHSMSIAQHLLRKYPQLKGRVFLSRQAHLRNQFAHMVHKYARRQNTLTH